MKLAALQQSFQAHLLNGDSAIEADIVGTGRFSIAMRLGVYADAYVARLCEVLADSFPALQAALGPARFMKRVGEFVRQHPSRFRSARDYGDTLSSWLGTRAEGPRAGALADLARFEWAVAGAFDAADGPALNPENLAGLTPAQWPQLRFTFAASLRRVAVSSNAVAWWKFACAEQIRPGRWRSTCVQEWLVWRQDLAVFYRRLSQAEAGALDAALAGHTFGELCEQLSAPAAAALLHRWFSDGLITGIALADA